ncbi:MAG: beta-ketoacyl-[acyl-carrier-protein] synthase family protein [Alphaproteobacteria bacterium]|nr:beta-ketoacyl-[acyl-carrier-protein] synthase family protein [Alphaproteobacteria bacterium]
MALAGRRIVVTGLGAVSPLGLDVAANVAAAREGRGAIRVQSFDLRPDGPDVCDFPAALVEGDVLGPLETALGRRIGASLDPFALFAVAATREALAQAQLIGHPALETRAALILGHGFAGIHTLEANYARLFARKLPKTHPLTIPKAMVSAPVSAAAMMFGLHGPVFAVSSACASSGHAIAQGAAMVQAGLVEIALVGGSEAIATPGSLRAWDGLQAMSPTACRPFSAGRDGMAIGEGGAVLVLESLDHALARGATILAEYGGAGLTSDAFHWTQPSLEGPSSAMRAALDAADLDPEAPLLISAHGTGTPLNDKNEAAAIRTVLGDAVARTPVIATKSAHGHLIGAAAALQTVIALDALGAGLAPPILGYLAPDPECDLDLVLGEARPVAARALLVNAFAFGGLNACLVFKRWE